MSDPVIKYGNIPPHARPKPKKYNTGTSNGLTNAIIDWCTLHGHHAERTGNEGRYIEGKTVTNVMGQTVHMKGKRIPSSGTKGTSDLKLCVWGRFIAIEVKVGKDRQSQDQLWYQQKVERAGGWYYIVKTFDEFLKLPIWTELK